MENLGFIGTIVGGVVLLLLVIGFIVARLYMRATKEQSFVRTGMGGQKVVKDGGAVILPVFHETIPINMQTLRLNVARSGKDSLITKDRLRVDVKAEFYVRVSPDADSIAAAAQTLGRRTLQPQLLAELIEGKFVDVLRAVAAGMEMQDLHEKRAEFVRQVQTTVAEDLKKNGLELESVSLTGLDQTPVEHFNPNNAFDAEGLAKLTSVTETRKKERNDIEQDNRIAIETKNLEANKRSLTIKQDQEFATLEQEREVETRRAQQEAELATQRAERQREADLARIAAEQATREGEVAKNQAIKIAETEAAKNEELAAQDQRIAVAQRSEEQSKALASAEAARADAVRAAEQVKTVEAEAQAERAKRVALIAAEQDAGKEATRIRVLAEAEFEAADAQAKAKERAVEADAKRYTVEAEGQRALNEAANLQSPEQVALLVRTKLIEQMPAILAQMVKPIEKIDSIRVVQMGGVGGQGGFNGEGGTHATGNLPTDLTNSMLNYRLQLPVVEELGRELGIDLNQGLNGIVNAAGTLTDTPVPATETRTRTKRTETRTSHPDAPLTAEEKAAIQTLAGITTPEDKRTGS